MSKWGWVAICLSVSLVGCASVPDSSLHGSSGGTVIWEYPSPTPEWILMPPPKDGKNYYFLGISGSGSDENTARAGALADAYSNMARFMGVQVNILDEYVTEGKGRESEAMDGARRIKLNRQFAAEWFFSKGKDTWYFRRVRRDKAELFEARVLVAMPAGEITTAMDYLGRKLARDAALEEERQESLAKTERRALVDDEQKNLVPAKGTATGDPTLGRLAAEQAARRAARHMAFANLNEIRNGVKVTGATIDNGNGVVDGAMAVSQSGRVKGRVISETVEWKNGVPIATVIVRGE